MHKKMPMGLETSKLDHRIIVFTGGIACGKTTIKQAFIRALERLGIETEEISGIRDLYLPFAQQKNLIPVKDVYVRQETTALMERLYATFGKSLGSHLLKAFLADKPVSKIYIVDSKRNPEGILEVRALFKNCLVIGVHASLRDRAARMEARKRTFDKNMRTKKEMIASFKEEERIFSIAKAINIADEIFINDSWFPNELTMRIADVLAKHGMIKNLHIDRTVSPPNNRTASKRVLKAGEMRLLLDHFVQEIDTNTVFVVQGGNRYAATYLAERMDVRCINLKLLCASKVSCAVILNTILDDRDKVQRLDSTQRKKIRKIWSTYSQKKKDEIKKACKMYSVSDEIESVLEEETVSVLIQIFAQETIKTHFTYPFNDADLQDELKKTRAAVEKADIEIEHLRMLQIIVSGTALHAYFRKEGGNIVFLDDVFYRGRTLFSIASILRIFKISQRHMVLYTLCVDQASAHFTSKHVKIMDRQVLYPFENSIRTENGYWQEKNGYFSFIDMGVYRGWLEGVVNKREARQIDRVWQKLTEKILSRVPKPHVARQEMLALIWLVVYHRCHSLPLSVKAVADQRGAGIGCCVAFVKCMEHFIPQEEPAVKRWAFKARIKSLIEEIQDDKQDKGDLVKAVEYYKTHAEAIDYMGLTHE